MIKSMTGFGRSSSEENGRSFIVEIKSVNHRYLDLSVKMPRSLIALEDRIRKLVQEKVSRGKIDIFITQNNICKEDQVARFNMALGDSYLKCLQDIRDRYNVRDDISVSLIARFPEVVAVQHEEDDIEELWNILASPVGEAISLLVAMRVNEGKALQEDIIKRCDIINELVNKVEKRAPLVVSEYRTKLEQRLKELIGDGKIIDENRIAMELAMYADKSNIDEEIVRLRSHIVQLKGTLSLNESVGRKLDFIVQEMNRETNTIGSKANDLELINLGLNIKNEIEKIREQIQNVE